jgi:hypothetical protein
MDQDKAPKAIWDAMSTTIFCEICMKQKKAGNRPTAFLSPEGYKNLAREFGTRTGRNYTKPQFKNKWDSTKALYQAWVYYTTKATGLGWDKLLFTYISCCFGAIWCCLLIYVAVLVVYGAIFSHMLLFVVLR